MKRTLLLVFLLLAPAFALDRPGVVFKIFQFPADRIPRIDGNVDDWKMVPDDYAIGTDNSWTIPTTAASRTRKIWTSK